MRRHLGRRRDTRRLRARSSASTEARAERCIRWSGRSSSAASARSRSTITLSASEGQPPSPELGGDGAVVHVPAARERRLLAVERERPARELGVLECAPEQRRRDDRPAVVGERDRAGVAELAQLGQLLALQRPSRSRP